MIGGKHTSVVQRRSHGPTYSSPSKSHKFVPSLPTTPRSNLSQGDTPCRDVLDIGMRSTVRKYVKNCHKCQVNKRHKHKYGKLPTKLVVRNPWEALCVDLIGPYTLKGKDKTEIDFMCLTMIDPATSWLEIIELPVVDRPTTVSYTHSPSPRD